MKRYLVEVYVSTDCIYSLYVEAFGTADSLRVFFGQISGDLYKKIDQDLTNIAIYTKEI